MDFAAAPHRFLNEIEMLDDSGIDGGHFSGMVTAENVVDVVQRLQIVLPLLVPITDTKPFIGMHVIDGELSLREFLSLGSCQCRSKEPAAQK